MKTEEIIEDKVNDAFNSLRSIEAVVDQFAGALSRKAVQEILRPRQHEQLIVRKRKQQFTDEDLLDAVREAESVGVSTVAGYRIWRTRQINTTSTTTPSLALIVQRFGSWSAARSLIGAGVARPRVSHGELKTFNDDHVRETFKLFVKVSRDAGQKPTPNAYEEWSRAIPSTPLLSTVRVRISAWRMTWVDFVRECESF